MAEREDVERVLSNARATHITEVKAIATTVAIVAALFFASATYCGHKSYETEQRAIEASKMCMQTNGTWIARHGASGACVPNQK